MKQLPQKLTLGPLQKIDRENDPASFFQSCGPLF